MIRQSEVIFVHKKSPVEKNGSARLTTGGLTKPSTKSRGLKGDSGVGQAPELPLKSRPNRFLTTFGNVLIFLSILGFLFTYGPIIKVEMGYRLSRAFPIEEEGVEGGYPKGGFAALLENQLLGEPEGVPDPNFSLIIPKIHAKGKVVPNINPADEGEYMEALKIGVAHAAGTQFPGNTGNIYMFAHSTDSPINIIRYNAVFYLLRELETGDNIEVYFGGVKHRYFVMDKKIVEPTDVGYLTPTNSEGKEQLILQTCWPPGTTLKRLLIFAEKKVS